MVQVRGKAALFTRPELKVERVSYPVMRPSTAVGVLEFAWRVVAIEGIGRGQAVYVAS
nr:CRISPR-associated protein Cas5 [Kibdelosporangium sp. MJ126-NF4]CEL17382.1 CRISPR-associated protein, Cas5d family [Kibdelosporangium sp. MJ126-NF4]CTQ91390.1 CRISPR-associated protein, Cas5d family [Kibdelosporangium sp. MJ126-NF4]